MREQAGSRQTEQQRARRVLDSVRTALRVPENAWQGFFEGSLKPAFGYMRDRVHCRIELVSMLVVVVYVPILVLQVLANAQMLSMSTPPVVQRELGDPQRGLQRIQTENFTTIEHLNNLARDPQSSDIERMVYTHTPLILRHSDEFPPRYNIPIGVYYQVSQSTSGSATATTIRYFLWFTDEDGGMPILDRLAKYGHSMDRELVYRVTLLKDDAGERVLGAYFQAPGHNHVKFDYDGSSRPVFTVASANHNFRRVFELELEMWSHGIIIPLPHYETINAPAHDPDFAAMAAREVWEKYQIDLRNFVFVEFDLPPQGAVTTVSIRIDDRWYYLHQQIGGVYRPGYNQVGINVGYAVLPGDISEVRIIAFTGKEMSFEPLRISIYPRSSVAA